MAFSIMNMIDNATNSNDYEIVSIDIDAIEVNENNFYNTNDVKELKDSIKAIGLQHNLTVTKVADKYRLISGHRRFKAYSELVKDNVITNNKIPCRIIEISELEEKLVLILSNSTARELSSFEKMKQIAELKQIAVEIKKEDSSKISGRVRDYVANLLNMTTSEVAKYEAIENNLSTELKEKFENNEINTSVAYETSKLPIEKQKEVKKIVEYKKEIGERVKADDVKNVFKLNTNKGAEILEQTNYKDEHAEATEDEIIHLEQKIINESPIELKNLDPIDYRYAESLNYKRCFIRNNASTFEKDMLSLIESIKKYSDEFNSSTLYENDFTNAWYHILSLNERLKQNKTHRKG